MFWRDFYYEIYIQGFSDKITTIANKITTVANKITIIVNVVKLVEIHVTQNTIKRLKTTKTDTIYTDM